MSVRVVVKGAFDGNLWHQHCGSGRHIRGNLSDAAWLLTAVTETLADSLHYLDRGGLEHFRRVPPVALETVTAIDVEEEASGVVTLLVSVKLVAPSLASGSNENATMEEKENEEGKEPLPTAREGSGEQRREAAAGFNGEVRALHPPPQEEGGAECCVCFKEGQHAAFLGLGACGHALCAACVEQLQRRAGAGESSGAVTCPLCRARSTTFLKAVQQWVWVPQTGPQATSNTAAPC